jgi:DNA-binding transcriptional LysR family regulator
MTSRQIEIFRAVMTTGSITSAAAILFTSQPTISRDLAQLESALKYPLFDRVGGRLRPTVRAVALFEEVRRSFIGMEHIQAVATNLRAFEHGQVSVVCVPGLSHSLLPGACRRLLAGNPHVCVSITPQDSPQLEELLTAQRYDLGITESETIPPGTTLETVAEAEEVCVIPEGHPLLAKEALAPEDLAGERFISLAPFDPFRLQIEECCRKCGVPLNIIIETVSAVSVCAMVQAGISIAVVNPLTARAFAGKGLEVRRFSARIPFRVFIARPVFRPFSPLTDRLIAVLRAEAQALLAPR